MEAFIAKFRSNSSRAAMVQSRIKVRLPRAVCDAAYIKDRYQGPHTAQHSSRSNHFRTRVLQALGRMEAVSEVLNDPSLCFSFPAPEPLSTPILQDREALAATQSWDDEST